MTPITGQLLLEEAQAGQATRANEILRVVDAVGQLRIASLTTAAEPATPAEGLVWFVPSGATGAVWAGQDGRLAAALAGGWVFLDPVDGMRGIVLDEGRRLAVWNAAASSWESVAEARAASGRGAGLRVLEEEVALAGAVAESTAFLPAGAIVLGVRSEVLVAAAGAASFDVGWSLGAVGDFGTGLGLAAGSSYHGTIDPRPLYAAQSVTITANGGSFTAGSVRLSARIISEV